MYIIAFGLNFAFPWPVLQMRYFLGGIINIHMTLDAYVLRQFSDYYEVLLAAYKEYNLCRMD